VLECREACDFAELIDAIRIRVDVFILEQGCPVGWEPDEFDKVAFQFVALLDGKVVGTARLRQDEPGSWKIERMAVDVGHRRMGVGSLLTRTLTASASARGATRLWLEAQTHARGVYEAAGFVADSAEYNLYGLDIPHVYMVHQAMAGDRSDVAPDAPRAVTTRA
jgi:predicted GNAT family N-acyltransferase